MNELFVTTPKTDIDFQKYYSLRWEVLRKPWGQPRGSERDELEDSSYHVMVCDEDGAVLGVGRLHLNSAGEGQIRYMAVVHTHQQKGIGGMLIKALEKKAVLIGAKIIILYSRDNAVPFYQKHAYSVIEKSYILFENIQHYKMEKTLKFAT